MSSIESLKTAIQNEHARVEAAIFDGEGDETHLYSLISRMEDQFGVWTVEFQVSGIGFHEAGDDALIESEESFRVLGQ